MGPSPHKIKTTLRDGQTVSIRSPRSCPFINLQRASAYHFVKLGTEPVAKGSVREETKDLSFSLKTVQSYRTRIK